MAIYNTIAVADSYQARVDILATILEYIAIRHRYSEKENEFAEEVERALQSLTSLIPLYNFDQGQGYCKSSLWLCTAVKHHSYIEIGKEYR